MANNEADEEEEVGAAESDDAEEEALVVMELPAIKWKKLITEALVKVGSTRFWVKICVRVGVFCLWSGWDDGLRWLG